MSGDAWAAAAIGIPTLGWAITSWVLSRALRHARDDGQVSARLAYIQRDLDRIASDTQRHLVELASQQREDRAATDRRLRWLETHVWTTGRQAG